MNFTSGRPGIYEEATGSRGNNISFSSSSSSSSSFQRRGFPTDCTYLHPQEGCAAAAPPPPDSSPTNNGPGGNEPADDSDDHMLYGRGEEGSNTGAVVIEREHMFDKVVTPSDVGKLNRLVIPKQHAEKYFPLDSSTNEKGLLLNFEDRTGKPWRFRYSYWNSSQSYVMTKGWSRFVKEKKLDAGDTVSFQRGVGELGKDRLFIDWRRRVPAHPPSIPTFSIPHEFSFHRSPIHPWRPLFMQPPPADYPRFLEATTPNPHYRHAPIGYNNPCPPGSVVYLRSAPGGGAFGSQIGMGQAERGSGLEQMLFNSVPVVQGKAAAKRLRLFGVNMDCPISESDECDILSSTTLPHPTVPLHHVPPPPFHNYSSSSSAIPRPNHGHPDEHKRKGSMSLDLDI